MTSTARRLIVVLLAVAALAAGVPAAFGQGSSTSSISGTVVDTSGAAVPGADITALNAANGTVFHAVSGEAGRDALAVALDIVRDIERFAPTPFPTGGRPMTARA